MRGRSPSVSTAVARYVPTNLDARLRRGGDAPSGLDPRQDRRHAGDRSDRRRTDRCSWSCTSYGSSRTGHWIPLSATVTGSSSTGAWSSSCRMWPCRPTATSPCGRCPRLRHRGKRARTRVHDRGPRAGLTSSSRPSSSGAGTRGRPAKMAASCTWKPSTTTPSRPTAG